MLKGVYEMTVPIIIIVCAGVFAIITVCIMFLSARGLGRMAYNAI